jgi:hypothetical protein
MWPIQVYDLLRPQDQDLPIREDQEKNIFIPNLAKVLQLFLSTCIKNINSITAKDRISGTVFGDVRSWLPQSYHCPHCPQRQIES